jgi:hypothetical protein
MEFTLESADVQWVQDTINKAMEELRQTTPNGRAFADTVGVILEREKNWVKWKNELCAPFDKIPWSTEMQGKSVGLLDASAEARRKMIDPPEDWPWSLGSEPLTEVWEMGYRDLQDLQMPFRWVISANRSTMADRKLQSWRCQRLCQKGETRRS